MVYVNTAGAYKTGTVYNRSLLYNRYHGLVQFWCTGGTLHIGTVNLW